MRKFANIALLVAGSICAVIGLLGFMGFLDGSPDREPEPEPVKPVEDAQKSAG